MDNYVKKWEVMYVDLLIKIVVQKDVNQTFLD